MENVTFKLGPLTPLQDSQDLNRCRSNEFDRNRFDQPVARVDRCQTCHHGDQSRRLSKTKDHLFKSHPRREVLFELTTLIRRIKFGCTGCHEGQGDGGQQRQPSPWRSSPVGIPAAARPRCNRAALLVISTCRSSHEDAPLLAEGQRLFEQVGCTGCHLVKGYENIPENRAELVKDQRQGRSWLDGALDREPA